MQLGLTMTVGNCSHFSGSSSSFYVEQRWSHLSDVVASLQEAATWKEEKSAAY